MSKSFGGDLEIEILVRLPAKSLMRFKCVKRSWNALLKTPYFVKRHMQMNMSDEQRLVIFPSMVQEEEKNALTILSLQDNSTITPIENIFSKNPLRICSFGHCNGVFCIQEDHRKDLVLWNPTTKEVHVLPQPSADIVEVEKAEELIGFGVDPNTNEFKLVKVGIQRHKHCLISFSSSQVYNHNNKSWTLIPCPSLPSETMPYHSGRSENNYNTLVNGVYHWLLGPNHNDHNFNILAFDFQNNQFQLLESPVQYCHCHHGIAEINGSLAYLSRHFLAMRIWVKNQQGWVLKYNIKVPLDPDVSVERALSKGKNDVQVLGRRSKQNLIMLYDKDGNLLRQYQINNLPCMMWVLEYVQSIAPLSA